jgi:hypothetical protein
MHETQMKLDAHVLEREVARYLATGESDPLACAFPGDHALERMIGYERHLRAELIAEVRRRQRGRRQAKVPADVNSPSWTRGKVEPMINGLFPASERQVVLQAAECSIVFLTCEAADQIIREVPYLESAWTIANVYLNSLGAPMLGNEAMQIVGLSLERKCYVSTEYFAEKDPFADYITHEVAHIFHNCKRETLGLPHTLSKEWLLDIAYAKRETFAYACETYGRIVEQAQGTAGRRALLAQYARSPKPSDETVDSAELLDILTEAVKARNGWKRILARCSSSNQPVPRSAPAYA